MLRPFRPILSGDFRSIISPQPSPYPSRLNTSLWRPVSRPLRTPTWPVCTTAPPGWTRQRPTRFIDLKSPRRKTVARRQPSHRPHVPAATCGIASARPNWSVLHGPPLHHGPPLSLSDEAPLVHAIRGSPWMRRTPTPGNARADQKVHRNGRQRNALLSPRR